MNPVAFLSVICLSLCCHYRYSVVAEQSQADSVKERTASGNKEDQSTDSSVESGTGSESSAKSGCKPLGTFISCHDVVQPQFDTVLGASEDGRPVDASVSLTALGRRFWLRLRADDLSGGDDEVASGGQTAWSSVISSATMVRVVGEGENDVGSYRADDAGIQWYSGYDAFEVAPSSVLASRVELDGQILLRAVIHTTSDVYYIEPTADHVM